MFTTGDLSVVDKVGLALSIGMIAGIGINTAHELGHKKEQHERWLAKIALAQTFYGHFYIEHNRGHHVRVATPEDPASSRVGESLYAFLPRTVIGSLRSAWRLEKPRFKRRGKSHWSIRNDVLNSWLMSGVLWGALLVAFGWALVPFLLVQAAVGISLLEIVNYLEHYGMRRHRMGEDGTGRYERVSRATRGTATTSRPTCCSTTCSGTATTTRTPPGATRHCVTTRSRRRCPPATRG